MTPLGTEPFYQDDVAAIGNEIIQKVFQNQLARAGGLSPKDASRPTRKVFTGICRTVMSGRDGTALPSWKEYLRETFRYHGAETSGEYFNTNWTTIHGTIRQIPTELCRGIWVPRRSLSIGELGFP